MKPEKLLLELELILEQTGYSIRYERGTFRGNDCVVEDTKIVMVNKNKPKESQIGTISRVLMKLDLEDIYIKPAVRKELVKIWEKIEAIEKLDEQMQEEGS